MASMKTTLDKFLNLMHDVENEYFESEDEKYMFCNGVRYSRGDFRNMERAVKQIKKVYGIGVDKSYRYLNKNKEYHRTMRMIGYYKNKKNKNPNDYVKLEELLKKMDKIKTDRNNAKIENFLKEIGGKNDKS